MPRLRPRALAAALAIGSLALASPALAEAACGSSGYAYAGLGASNRAYGVATNLQTVGTPQVLSGHVAGWVGVGGPGSGPNGTNEWIQVGFSAFPDSLGNDLYFEMARPGTPPRYSRIRAGIPAGQQVRVSVLELGARPNWWRIWVDGSPVTPPIYLPDSDRRWGPVATAESWNAGGAACNDFGYRFARVRVALTPGGAWTNLPSATPLSGPQTIVVRRSDASFVAAAGRLARQLSSAMPRLPSGAHARSLRPVHP